MLGYMAGTLLAASINDLGRKLPDLPLRAW